jgi:hypothetical protein
VEVARISVIKGATVSGNTSGQTTTKKSIDYIWLIPPLPQYDITTCWEAVGHMAFSWKFKAATDRERKYWKKTGKFATDFDAKNRTELAEYYKKLGMSPANLTGGVKQLEGLLGYSPLAIIRIGKKLSHVMLLVGYNDRNFIYINPQAINTGPSTQHTFGEHSYNAKTKTHTQNTVITKNTVKMKTKQPSWTASYFQEPKTSFYPQLLNLVFGYFPSRTTQLKGGNKKMSSKISTKTKKH